jgi:hypothetical protein
MLNRHERRKATTKGWKKLKAATLDQHFKERPASRARLAPARLTSLAHTARARPAPNGANTFLNSRVLPSVRSRFRHRGLSPACVAQCAGHGIAQARARTGSR